MFQRLKFIGFLIQSLCPYVDTICFLASPSIKHLRDSVSCECVMCVSERDKNARRLKFLQSVKMILAKLNFQFIKTIVFMSGGIVIYLYPDLLEKAIGISFTLLGLVEGLEGYYQHLRGCLDD